jgi:hypothetical protein
MQALWALFSDEPLHLQKFSQFVFSAYLAFAPPIFTLLKQQQLFLL